MFDPTTLIDLFGAVAVVALPAIVLRRLAGTDGPDLATMFRMPLDPPRPRGVQEEEPVPWRLELVRPRSSRPGPAVDRRPTERRLREPGLDPGGCA